MPASVFLCALCGYLQPRLIELKLVTWRYKDRGDVVELIRRNQFPETLADHIHPTVRSVYRQCYDQANEEDYDRS